MAKVASIEVTINAEVKEVLSKLFEVWMKMLGWQPIESAPTDGTVIQVTGCNGFYDQVTPAFYSNGGPDLGRDYVGWLGLTNCGIVNIAPPTYWQKMATAPVFEGQA